MSPGAAPVRAVLGSLSLGHTSAKGKGWMDWEGKGYRTHCGTHSRGIWEACKTYNGIFRGGTMQGEREESWWFGKE